ncbi:MmgE/PrpD family protein [Pseudonocardia adelaidensis]|uniref:2-methylcitrate dehydratase PrpD n=1 Tax=Pseudonocardia adelaidensis TaxID=648754 RepID=A0ABP9NRZ9_9PSEU
MTAVHDTTHDTPAAGAFAQAPALERALVDHIAGTGFADLPDAAVEAARSALLWFLATAVAGSGAPGSDAIAAYAADLGGSGDAPILGTGTTTSPEAAAFANAAFAKAHEWEDKYWLSPGGGYAMGYAVVAAALGAAERAAGADGRTLLTAVALATDVQARMLEAAVVADPLTLSPTRTPWNPTYLFSNYGAAVAAGKVAGLDRDQLVNALGLTHAQACGNFQGQMEGVLGIRLQAGFVVRNGLTAVGLAQRGIDGARQFISGKHGFYDLHFPGAQVDLDRLVRDLGRELLGARLGFKAYPCGVVAHPVLDAARAVRDAVDLTRVARIRVYGTRSLHIMSEPIDAKRDPVSPIQAQFSLPWVVACVLRDGDLRLDHLRPEALNGEDLRRLAQHVEVVMEADRSGVVLEVVDSAGRTTTSDEVTAGKGHPDNPLTREDMIAVYHQGLRHAARPIPADMAAAALAMVLDADSVDDVRELARRLG